MVGGGMNMPYKFGSIQNKPTQLDNAPGLVYSEKRGFETPERM